MNFLKRVYLRALPFNASSYETLTQIMLVEKTPAYTMWAKTGWATRAKPQVGWYVGYVERGGATWLFALNMTIRSPADLPLRQQLVVAGLQVKGILPRPVNEGR